MQPIGSAAHRAMVRPERWKFFSEQAPRAMQRVLLVHPPCCCCRTTTQCACSAHALARHQLPPCRVHIARPRHRHPARRLRCACPQGPSVWAPSLCAAHPSSVHLPLSSAAEALQHCQCTRSPPEARPSACKRKCAFCHCARTANFLTVPWRCSAHTTTQLKHATHGERSKTWTVGVPTVAGWLPRSCGLS